MRNPLRRRALAAGGCDSEDGPWYDSEDEYVFVECLIIASIACMVFVIEHGEAAIEKLVDVHQHKEFHNHKVFCILSLLRIEDIFFGC